MKKIITLILGLCLCFALMGCGGSGSSSSNYIPNPSDGMLEPANAYYEDGNITVPIYIVKKPITSKTFIVKSEQYTWYIRCFTDMNISYEDTGETIRLENKDGIVTIPEEYANEKYIIKTNYNNLLYHILITRKKNTKTLSENIQSYGLTPAPDLPATILAE